MANCIIYAYAKPDGKIVYVGQTKQLSTRHKQHMEYDPYRPTAVEYNYPLSRGVRKYGKDYYSLVILEENVPPEKLDNRESINHPEFEAKIYEIVPEHQGDYHMCVYIARSFMEERRWEEVFPALYGDMPKYRFLKNENE